MATAHRLAVLAVFILFTSGCAALAPLAKVISPPTFEQERSERSEVRLIAPGREARLGGAAVRIWTRVKNPNAFGIRLGALEGDLYLEGSRAANASLPLGMRLGGQDETVIPLDIQVDFADVPGLGGALRRAVAGEPVAFRLDGIVTVDAGPLGQPSFGPMTWLSGELDTRALASRRE